MASLQPRQDTFFSFSFSSLGTTGGEGTARLLSLESGWWLILRTGASLSFSLSGANSRESTRGINGRWARKCGKVGSRHLAGRLVSRRASAESGRLGRRQLAGPFITRRALNVASLNHRRVDHIGQEMQIVTKYKAAHNHFCVPPLHFPLSLFRFQRSRSRDTGWARRPHLHTARRRRPASSDRMPW